MTQGERRVYLIRFLLAELPQSERIGIPEDARGQKRLLRALMNLRPPLPAAEEFLKVQDEYLSEEIRRDGITDSGRLPASRRDSRLTLWRGDITRLKADAVVNAANSALLGCFHPCHGCIDNVIHTFAGVQLRLACYELMQRQGHEEPAGRAKITKAFNLPSRFVLHTVGPVVSGAPAEKDCAALAGCYRSCLQLAAEYGLQSVAFCCVSTGVFHFPQEQAATIAVDAVLDFLAQNRTIQRVLFDVFTQKDFAIYSRLLDGKEEQGNPVRRNV